MNFAPSKQAYVKEFGEIPKRPLKGKVIAGDYDFTKVNTLTPHPIYSWMCWVAILNLTRDTFEKIQPLLQESYQRVEKKHLKKMAVSKG